MDFEKLVFEIIILCLVVNSSFINSSPPHQTYTLRGTNMNISTNTGPILYPTTGNELNAKTLLTLKEFEDISRRLEEIEKIQNQLNTMSETNQVEEALERLRLRMALQDYSKDIRVSVDSKPRNLQKLAGIMVTMSFLVLGSCLYYTIAFKKCKFFAIPEENHSTTEISLTPDELIRPENYSSGVGQDFVIDVDDVLLALLGMNPMEMEEIDQNRGTPPPPYPCDDNPPPYETLVLPSKV